MTRRLEQKGIFLATARNWSIQMAKDTKAVAIAIQFTPYARLDGSEWTDLTQFDETTVWGSFWIGKKDGSFNQDQAERLMRSRLWDGKITSVGPDTPPPETPVQIKVKCDTYNGRTTYKVCWINPEDYSPVPAGTSPEEVRTIDALFGSQLRAVASMIAQEEKAKPAAPPPPTVQAPAPETVPDDGLPF